MHKPIPRSFLIALLGLFLAGMAHAKPIDSLEDVLKSAPPSAMRKLFAKPDDAKSLAEINEYFGRNVVGQKAVIEAEIEFVRPNPGGGQAFSARALATPVKWKDHTVERLNNFYFPAATMPAEGAIKVGSKVKVTGTIRRCEIMNKDGKLQMNFDLTESKL